MYELKILKKITIVEEYKFIIYNGKYESKV